MPFELCCDSPNKTSYSLDHKKLSANELSTLMQLVLYLPEINSRQSEHSTPLVNDIYESFFLKKIMRILNLNDEDLLINECLPKRIVNPSIVSYFESGICLNCSKIYLAKCRGKNKVITIFNRLRDIIAHGFFNIVNNIFIGFSHPSFTCPDCNGIIKVSFDSLSKMCDEFTSYKSTLTFFKVALLRNGYQENANETNNVKTDLILRKNGKTFFFDFKQFRGRFIKADDIKKYINNINEKDKNIIRILIVDSTYTNKNINEILSKYGVHLFDKRCLKKLLNEEDIFKELDSELIKI